MVVDKIVVALGDKFLPHVNREDEGPPPSVVGVPWTPRQPGVVGEAADCLAELGAHQDQGVTYVVALLVEGGGPEPVFGCPEESLNPGGVAEDVLEEAQLLLGDAWGAEVLQLSLEGVAKNG